MTDWELMEQARAAAKMSYSPYSHFAVGAAALTSDGAVFRGCNIENAAYSSSVCAERVAVLKAVSEGAGKITAVAVYSEGAAPCMPCGECRQVLSELCGAELRVIFEDGNGGTADCLLGQLLPHAFKPDEALS